MKHPKALIFKQIFEYEYPAWQRRVAHEEYTTGREMRFPSTDDWIVGFKIGPLVQKIVDLLLCGNAEITYSGNRVLAIVSLNDIMTKTLCIEYEDFTEEWMKAYSTM